MTTKMMTAKWPEGISHSWRNMWRSALGSSLNHDTLASPFELYEDILKFILWRLWASAESV